MTHYTKSECLACRGHGYVEFTTRSPAGYRRDHEAECLRCDGDGWIEVEHEGDELETQEQGR